MEGRFLTCQTKDGPMEIYVSSPQGEGKFPVLLVFQEAFGVNSHIQSICQRFAEEGFVAVAPELFHREGKHLTVEYSARKEIMPLLGKLTNMELLSDIRATIDFLPSLPKVDGEKLFTIGFCVGGFASLLAATEFPVKKMVSFYGGGIVHKRPNIGLDPLLEKVGKVESDSLFFFGGKDASIPPDDVQTLQKTLIQEEIPHEVVVFPTADHGFFCDERKSYDETSAKEAWKKTLNFFHST
jgi:carboxymethylenebutenolidase